MKKSQKIITSISILIVLVLLFYFVASIITRFTGYSISPETRLSEFDECLQKQDITLYINSNNPTETFKELDIGDYLKDIKIVNCARGSGICTNEQVNSIFINGNRFEKGISKFGLAKNSGCKLD